MRRDACVFILTDAGYNLCVKGHRGFCFGTRIWDVMKRVWIFSIAMFGLITALSLGAGANETSKAAEIAAEYSARVVSPLPPLVFERFPTQQDAVRSFWTYQAMLSLMFLGGSYLLGRQVIRRNWKVGYTRKAQALLLYFLPYAAMNTTSPYSEIVTATYSLGLFALLLVLMSAPVRTYFPPAATAFACIDRPEDRPFTLTWLLTSVIAVWGVVCLWIWLAPDTLGYLFVAFFISGVGDALAEPVGLYFGRHPYRTTALFTDKTYIRTLEGSAVVFVSGVVAVLIVDGSYWDTQTLAALVLFPCVGALAEAKSPHTWDQPFIIASCALVAVCVSLL